MHRIIHKKCELCKEETKCRTWDALDGNTKKSISLEIGVKCYMELMEKRSVFGTAIIT